MGQVNQILALVKQELRSASRTRYIVISFVLMPLIMWGLQGGVQLLIGFSITSSQEGETIYVVNYDTGNGTVNMGDFFVNALKYQTQNNNSLLYGATINEAKLTGYNYSQLMSILKDPKSAGSITPLIIIPANFTEVYTAFDINTNPVFPKVELYTMPSGLIGSSVLEAAIGTVAASYPFTQVNIEKATVVSKTTITFPGEEGASSGFGAGFIGFLSILIAVMAPAPFISASFAGEREKKTMESLLALPISRFNILLGKVIAGMVLLTVFSLMNLVGLMGFAFMMSKYPGMEDAGESFSFAIEPTLMLLFLVAVTMFLSAFISIGIGISVASLAKDVRSAESLYSLVMIIPSMAVGLTGMFGSLPEQQFGGAGMLLYLIPWSHSLALLNKGLYPQTYASSTITGSIPTDILFHLGYITLMIVICLFIASKVFERESILT
ncbi:MAG: ABC transporter permease [Candidatus Hodarchaeales archaeon]